jgi:signal transduction histidine kinase
LRDISERKRMEKALKRINSKLNLLSSITRHDLTNTLSVLYGWLLLLKEEVTKPEQQELIARIEEACENLKAQIAFTKQYQELGVREPGWHRVGVSYVQDQITVDIRPEALNLEIFADPMFGKVIENLIDNTRRHSEKATTVTIGALETGGNLVLVVSDDGIGVPEDQKERIFEPHFGKNQGLGLFLCREILSVTGMMVRETGVPGRGASFEITVPKGNFRNAG